MVNFGRSYGLVCSAGGGVVQVGGGEDFQTARVALVAAMARTAPTKAQRMPEKASVQLNRKRPKVKMMAVAVQMTVVQMVLAWLSFIWFIRESLSAFTARVRWVGWPRPSNKRHRAKPSRYNNRLFQYRSCRRWWKVASFQCP